METFPVAVVLIIASTDPNDQENVQYAFLEQEDILSLPKLYLDDETRAEGACVRLAMRHIRADIKWLATSIIPVGFYDVAAIVGPSVAQSNCREILLVFKATIPETIQLKLGIHWYTYEELRRAQGRIAGYHFRLLRETLPK
jgi:hypothetical protein